MAWNPYAPPATSPAIPVSPGVWLPREGRSFQQVWLKWAFLACQLAQYGLVVAQAANPGGLWINALEVGAIVFSRSAGAFGLWWLHAAWRARPFPKHYDDVSAAKTVLRLFLPGYGYYWTFAAHYELADSLAPDASRSVVPSQVKLCALLACALEVACNIDYVIVHMSDSASAANWNLLGLCAGLGRWWAWFAWMTLWEGTRSRVRVC